MSRVIHTRIVYMLKAKRVPTMWCLLSQEMGTDDWEERFCTPPPPGGNFGDRECARIETKASIHHPLWVVVVVVVVYRIDLPNDALQLGGGEPSGRRQPLSEEEEKRRQKEEC